MANNSDVFQRLIGLETEYALFTPSTGVKPRLNRHAVYCGVVGALRTLIPCVRARNMKEGVFHAAGGAVWFETERPAAGGGLIEGSTPECRGPTQLLTWQRAQDELLAEATELAHGSSVRLVKNDRDAVGNVYGSQENYEATLATGWRLALWRGALVLLLPPAAVTWLLLWLIDVGVTCYALLATVIYLTAERFLPRPEWLSMLLFGCTVKDLSAESPTGPAWLEALLSFLARVITAPLAVALFAVLWLTAFTKIRRQLTPFLISRAVIAGSGSIDDKGNFLLADKALSLNCLTGFGGLLGDRPLFCLGHFFKAVYADAWLAPQQYFHLFRPRQRLQIALGDSNLADVAEYLRIGTTLLVIDAIEAGELPGIPRIGRPMRALHTIASDPSLAAAIDLYGGQRVTALDLQRFYWHACRRFLEKRPDAPHEARDVLRRWEAVLDRLTDDPPCLIGSLDWVTKQFVLDKSGRGAAWDAKKKIDLRYHELSPQGYFQRLRATGVVSELLEHGDIEHARRNPPPGSPAAVRGRYIREFGADDEPITANWHAVFLGHGREAKVVRLDRYHAGSSTNQKAKIDSRKTKGS